MNTKGTKQFIDEVYNQYEHFIVIGLTGRCGSGCSTVKDYLCGNNTPNPKSFISSSKEKTNNQTRDLNVLVNFADKNKILPFQVISVRSILTSYILDDIEAFYEALKDICSANGPSDMFEKYVSKEYPKIAKEFKIEEKAKQCKELWHKLDQDIYSCIAGMTIKDFEFLFVELDEIGEIIRGFLRSLDKDAYTIVYQYVGNAVRTFGALPTKDKTLKQKAENIHSIAKRINSLIKVYRRREWICEGNKEKPIYNSDVHVVIDSIKNVFEADYLKARYHSFYLLAITLDDKERRFRLREHKELDERQIDIIDLREQPARVKELWGKENAPLKEELEKFDYNNIQAKSIFNDTYLFNLQDVNACIQNADILINNKGTESDLKMCVLRYVCLMMHPGLVLPTDDERCMQIAQTAKVNSGCASRQVGAVVCDSNNNIISVGWNDPSATMGNECISCIRRELINLCARDDTKAFSYYELYDPTFRERVREIITDGLVEKGMEKEELDGISSLKQLCNNYIKEYADELGGLPAVYCFKDVYCSIADKKNQIHTRAQHAEERALEFCDKHNTVGGILYTTSSSCELCAKKALSYSIARIVYIEPYSGITNDHILGHKVEHGEINPNRTNTEDEPIEEWKESIVVELFTGATKKAYDQLYSAMFPIKDELVLRGVKIK